MIVRRSFTVNNDFKKSSYWLTIIFFLIGIAALVCVSAAKYFQFDELVVTVGQIVSPELPAVRGALLAEHLPH